MLRRRTNASHFFLVLVGFAETIVAVPFNVFKAKGKTGGGGGGERVIGSFPHIFSTDKESEKPQFIVSIAMIVLYFAFIWVLSLHHTLRIEKPRITRQSLTLSEYP